MTDSYGTDVPSAIERAIAEYGVACMNYARVSWLRTTKQERLRLEYLDARAKAMRLIFATTAPLTGEKVVKASVSLFDCECEFADLEGAEGACSEYRDHWDQAVIDYKQAANEGVPYAWAKPLPNGDGLRGQ